MIDDDFNLNHNKDENLEFKPKLYISDFLFKNHFIRTKLQHLPS